MPVGWQGIHGLGRQRSPVGGELSTLYYVALYDLGKLALVRRSKWIGESGDPAKTNIIVAYLNSMITHNIMGLNKLNK